MIIKCDYCGIEFERDSVFKKNFCKPSHRVNYCRLRKPIKTKEEALKRIYEIKPNLKPVEKPKLETKERKIVSSWSA